MAKNYRSFSLLIVVLILSFSFAELVSVNHKIRFLLDLIHFQQCTPKIIALTCSKKEEKRDLSRALSNSSVAVRFWEPKSFVENLRFIAGPVTFLIDMQCPDSKTVLERADLLNIHFGFRSFQEPFHWILFDHNSAAVRALNVYFGVNSQVFAVNNTVNQFKVQSVYKYSRGDSSFMKNDIGTWTPEKRFLYFNKLIYARNRSDLGGTNLKVIYSKRNIPNLDASIGIRAIKSKKLIINVVLIEMLCSYLNATFVPIVQNSSSSKEYRNISGSMFLSLKNGNVDLLGTPLRICKEQLDDFRYLVEGTVNLIVFVYRAPGLAYMENVYVMPFNTVSWICLLSTLVIASLVMYVMVIFHRNVSSEAEVDLSFFDILMLQCATAFQKSSSFEFKSYSGRVATAFLHLTLMILMVSYTASIVVYLQATTRTIRSFRDLYDSGIELGTENSSAMIDNYMMPHEHLVDEAFRQEIFREKIQGKRYFLTAEEGMRRVRTEFFAFETRLATAYENVANTFYELEKCSLRTTLGFYSGKHRYLMVARNSSLIDLYRIGFRKIIESGLQMRQYLILYRQKPKCKSTGISNYSGTGLIETKFVFLIFIFGTLLSLGIFILENLVYRYRNSIKYYQHYNGVTKFFGGIEVQPYVD